MLIFKIKNKGFTLVEVLVSVAIVSIIMSVVLFQGRQLINTSALSTAAQDVSISIREAQSYGISVKSTGSGQFNYGYGVAFDTSSGSSVFIFSDLNSNAIYDGDTACSSGTECIKKIPIQGDITISQICGVTGGSINCPGSAQKLSVTFLRPSPDPMIKITNGSGSVIGGTWFAGRVTLLNRDGRTKFVMIDTVGKLSIQ